MPVAESDIQASLDAVIDDVERNRRIFGFFASNIITLADATRSLNAKVDDGFAAVDQRFDQVDERFDQVDQRFEQVDQRFDQVDQRFEQVDQRFDQVDQRFKEVDQRFDGVESELAEAKSDLADVKRHVAQIAVRTEEMPKVLAGLEELRRWIKRDELRGSREPGSRGAGKPGEPRE